MNTDSHSMKIRLLLAGVLSLTVPSSAHAENKGAYSAEALTKGGTFCFQIGNQSAGQFQHLRLVSQRPSTEAPYNVIPINGVEHGLCKDYDYENAFVGTATLAPSSVPGAGGNALLITLTGGGNSYQVDGMPVIWMQHYILELNPNNLSGKVLGYDMGSGAVADGKQVVTKVMTYVNKDISPIDCKAFK